MPDLMFFPLHGEGILFFYHQFYIFYHQFYTLDMLSWLKHSLTSFLVDKGMLGLLAAPSFECCIVVASMLLLFLMSWWEEPFVCDVATTERSALWLCCTLALQYFLVAFKALLTEDRTALEPTACWIAFERRDCLFTIYVKTAAFFSADSNNETSSLIFCFI